MREIVHLQAGQCGNQIGTKVGTCHVECQRVLFDKWLPLLDELTLVIVLNGFNRWF